MSYDMSAFFANYFGTFLMNWGKAYLVLSCSGGGCGLGGGGTTGLMPSCSKLNRKFPRCTWWLAKSFPKTGNGLGARIVLRLFKSSEKFDGRPKMTK